VEAPEDQVRRRRCTGTSEAGGETGPSPSGVGSIPNP
jgi:hypothetical protein